MRTLEEIKHDIETYRMHYTDEGLKQPQAVVLERIITELLAYIECQSQ